MKKYICTVFAAFLCMLHAQKTNASSLDDIYRSIIRDDNQGYLPVYVKNRVQPEMLIDEENGEFSNAETKKEKQTYNNPEDKPISLINKQKLEEEARLKRLHRWQEAVKAVQNNRVTPKELAEIESYATRNDPKAIEILAWMNTRGVGVRQDLIKAFQLYYKAAELNVPQAKKNAALIYKAMTRQQKELLVAGRTGFKPEFEEIMQTKPADAQN